MGASEDLALMIIFMILLSGVASRDMEVFVNDTVAIRCSPNKSVDIQWHHNSDLNYVYAGGRFFLPYKGRFRLEKDATTGEYDLIIPKVTLEDAGWYLCQEELSGHRISKTQLTVLYVNPVCSFNMPSDGFVGPNTCNLQRENMTFSCDVKFNGRPPYVIWRSAKDSQTFCSSSCEDASNDRRICSLTISADSLYDGSVFICDAITPSDRRFSCNTEMVKVWYFLAHYENAKKKVQDSASCAVRNNLNVQYKWTLKKNSEHILLSANQTIFFQQSGIYQCEVDYRIRNVACSALVLNVTVDDIQTKQVGNTLLAVILPITLVVLVIALIGSIIYIVKLRRRTDIRSDHFLRRMDDDLAVKMKSAIDDNWENLLELIVTSQLVDRLKENRVFDEEQLNAISSKSTSREKNEALLKILRDGNLHSFYRTIRCLHQSNQSDAAEILITHVF